MTTTIPIRYKTAEPGLASVLGSLESEIMQIMWHDQSGTVRTVYRQLAQRRELAYTTVMTTMTRLAEKGLLIQHPPASGNAYRYTPAMSCDEFNALTVRHVLDSLLAEHYDLVVAYLAERSDLQAQIAQ